MQDNRFFKQLHQLFLNSTPFHRRLHLSRGLYLYSSYLLSKYTRIVMPSAHLLNEVNTIWEPTVLIYSFSFNTFAWLHLKLPFACTTRWLAIPVSGHTFRVFLCFHLFLERISFFSTITRSLVCQLIRHKNGSVFLC